jgi:hypothetical protein
MLSMSWPLLKMNKLCHRTLGGACDGAHVSGCVCLFSMPDVFLTSLCSVGALKCRGGGVRLLYVAFSVVNGICWAAVVCWLLVSSVCLSLLGRGVPLYQ